MKGEIPTPVAHGITLQHPDYAALIAQEAQHWSEAAIWEHQSAPPDYAVKRHD